MQLVTVDVETFWSKTHTLTKMSAPMYVKHPDTEIISCSIKIGRGKTQVFFGEAAVKVALRSIDWSDTLVIGHNMSGFDAMILRWRFGIQPKMWGCTLAMARPIHGVSVGNSLAKLVKHYATELSSMGIAPEKNNAVLVQTQGKKLADFTPAELAAMRTYNGDDADQCWGLFQLLKKHYTARELWHIDATIRMLVDPAFEADVALLETALSVERDNKLKGLIELGKLLKTPGEMWEAAFQTGQLLAEQVRTEMASSQKFAELLERLDVPVPMKPSPTNPDKQVPALAKTDEAFLKLQDHRNPIVALAARTRLSVKSTLLETRIEAFLEVSGVCGGWWPVPLHYCGAATTGRWSGWLYNPQNMPRIIVGKPKVSDALRNSVRAPQGHKVVVADLSGIELRVNHFLWQVPSSMRLFRDSPDKADLYKDFASRLYDVTVQEVTKEQRQIGKLAHLGLGFQSGPATFQRIAKMMGGVDMPEAEAMSVTYKWREEYAPIVEGWKRCHEALPHILTGERFDIDPWGLTHTEKGAIVLPSGRRIRYPSLVCENGGGKREWFYGEGRNRARIYAGKIDENIVQALARDCIADNAYEMFRRTGLRPALMVHDELVYVVKDEQAHDALATLQLIMRTPPAWWPDLVTWSEGDVAQTYGSAK